MKIYVGALVPEYRELPSELLDGPFRSLEPYYEIDYEDVRWLTEWRCVDRKRKYHLVWHPARRQIGWFNSLADAMAAAERLMKRQ